MLVFLKCFHGFHCKCLFTLGCPMVFIGNYCFLSFSNDFNKIILFSLGCQMTSVEMKCIVPAVLELETHGLKRRALDFNQQREQNKMVQLMAYLQIRNCKECNKLQYTLFFSMSFYKRLTQEKRPYVFVVFASRSVLVWFKLCF